MEQANTIVDMRPRLAHKHAVALMVVVGGTRYRVEPPDDDGPVRYVEDVEPDLKN